MESEVVEPRTVEGFDIVITYRGLLGPVSSKQVEQASWDALGAVIRITGGGAAATPFPKKRGDADW